MHLALSELSAGMKAKTFPPLKMRRGIKNISLNTDLAQTNRTNTEFHPVKNLQNTIESFFFTVI